MTFEQLLKEYSREGLTIYEVPLPSNLKGFILDTSIYINSDMTDTEKACVLLEEIGHHKTTVGDILDQTDAQNRKQEAQARDWAVRKAVSLEALEEVAADPTIEHNAQAAEALSVTESVLRHAVQLYRRKSGLLDCRGGQCNYEGEHHETIA